MQDHQLAGLEGASRVNAAFVITELNFKQDWLGGRDSNPDTQIQSLQSYR